MRRIWSIRAVEPRKIKCFAPNYSSCLVRPPLNFGQSQTNSPVSPVINSGQKCARFPDSTFTAKAISDTLLKLRFQETDLTDSTLHIIALEGYYEITIYLNKK
jgi:hypothetical protein